jgi:hypothetical protein
METLLFSLLCIQVSTSWSWDRSQNFVQFEAGDRAVELEPKQIVSAPQHWQFLQYFLCTVVRYVEIIWIPPSCGAAPSIPPQKAAMSPPRASIAIVSGFVLAWRAALPASPWPALVVDSHRAALAIPPWATLPVTTWTSLVDHIWRGVAGSVDTGTWWAAQSSPPRTSLVGKNRWGVAGFVLAALAAFPWPTLVVHSSWAAQVILPWISMTFTSQASLAVTSRASLAVPSGTSLAVPSGASPAVPSGTSLAVPSGASPAVLSRASLAVPSWPYLAVPSRASLCEHSYRWAVRAGKASLSHGGSHLYSWTEISATPGIIFL